MPQHIFDVIERMLIEKYRIEIEFRKNRMEAEIELNRILESPTIDQIYKALQERLKIDDELLAWIKEKEFAIELSYMIPRNKMVEIFTYAVKQKKKIFLLSDMYWPKERIKILLNKCGINGYEEIIVSCDINKTKNSGSLYAYYQSMTAAEEALLHIGDNPHADVKMSELYGIKSFRILSGYEMLTLSSFQELLIHVQGIESSHILGLFVARAFNDPFALHSGRGKLSVNQLSDLGYLFIGPLVLSFVIWLINQLNNLHCDKILFSARDGYLIEQVYQMMAKTKKDNAVKGIYFKTSRRAITVASIYHEEDIRRILEKPFKGSFSSLLQERFGITMTDEQDVQAPNPISIEHKNQNDIFFYKNEIIKNAAQERDYYLNYIERLGIKQDEKLALFDLVSAGTIQYYLSKLIKSEIVGLYFVKIDAQDRFYNNSIDVRALLGEANQYQMQNNVTRYSIFLESLFTDPNPSLIKCAGDGEFVYETEKTMRAFEDIQECHQGIREFVADMICMDINITDRKPNVKEADNIFGMLFTPKCIVSPEVKKAFYWDSHYDFESEVNLGEILFS